MTLLEPSTFYDAGAPANVLEAAAVEGVQVFLPSALPCLHASADHLHWGWKAEAGLARLKGFTEVPHGAGVAQGREAD